MDYIQTNKKLWDTKTDIHYASDFYDVPAFIKGKDSLNGIELDLLGDVTGKKILHLQCHFGMDTISLTRRGALATGVDLSTKAIAKARELAEKVNASTQFVESNVYDIEDKLLEKYDIIYTSYGVVGWLQDLSKWAELIALYLKPGGKLVFVEFHPVIWMFSYDFTKVEFNYHDATPIIEELEGTYTDRDADIKEQSVSWNHGMAAVLNALIKSGLVIQDFQEYNYSPYDCFQNTIHIGEGKYQIKGLENKLPMVYSVVAAKPA